MQQSFFYTTIWFLFFNKGTTEDRIPELPIWVKSGGIDEQGGQV